MKKLITLLTLLLCAGVSSWATTGTDKASTTNPGSSKDLVGTSYTIGSTYNAGAGSAKAGDMPNNGVKLRTGSDNNKAVFTVNSGYTITDFMFNAIANDDGSIIATSVTIDDDETNLLSSNVTFTKSTNAKITLSGINATSKITITFDNTNVVKNKQLNAYYEIGWSVPDATEPLGTTVTPSSATLTVGRTVTLTGAFTGGDFEGEWVSDNETVATVSAAGLVTAVAEGTAHITYQWVDDQSKDSFKGTSTINVNAPKPMGDGDSDVLDILKYETINLENTYSFDTDEVLLVAGAKKLRANKSKLPWVYDGARGSGGNSYDATGVFKGSAFYGESSNVGVSLQTGNYFGLVITNCREITALVNAGSSSKTTITLTMAVYEMTSNGLNRASDTPVATATAKGTSMETISIANLDDEKIYQVYFSNNYNSNSYVFEVGFYGPGLGEDTSLSFPEDSYELVVGESFTAPTLTTDPTTLTGIVYSSSNEAVATVDAETGAVTLVGIGTTTITAKFPGDDTYNPSQASYTLTVSLPEIDEKTWDFSTWDDNGNIDYETTTIVDGLVIAANSSSKVSINSNVLKFGGTGAADKRHIHFKIASGKHVIAVTARHGGSGDNRSLRLAFGEFGKNNKDFSMAVSSMPATLYYLYEGNATDVYIYSANSGINLSDLTVSSDVPVTISEAGWATFVAPFALDFSGLDQSVEAYTATLDESIVTLTKVENVQAGTGLVLKGNGTTMVPLADASTTEKGDLKGSAEDFFTFTDEATDSYYGLAMNDDNKAQFAKLNPGTINPGKAYLKVSASSAAGVRSFFVIADNTTTGIESVKNMAEKGTIYNLQGVRVERPVKGLYIQNGKKVLVK